MSKTITQILTGKRTGWAIINEEGKLLETFRLRMTAEQWLPKIQSTTRKKLKVIEINNDDE